MTPAEIRSLYVETLAVALNAQPEQDWVDLESLVDALAAAGLLPVGAEWGYGCGIAGCDVDQCESTIHEATARLRRPEGGPLWLRYFTGWREVSE